MPQQTKTEAMEEILRKARRDILDGTAPLDGVWWWSDDVKMADRIAHVLLDYDRDDEPTLRKQLVEMESLLASARHSRDEAVKANARLTRGDTVADLDKHMIERMVQERRPLPTSSSSETVLGVRALVEECLAHISLIDDLNRQLDEVHTENARLVQKVLGQPAPVEEQGPWVVYDTEGVNEGGMPWRSREAWNWEICGTPFPTKEEAQDVIDDFGQGNKTMRVITLAEARAIEAATKAGGQ